VQGAVSNILQNYTAVLWKAPMRGNILG
jgi:hypothetical protein